MATTSSSSPKGFKNVSKRLHGLLRTRGSSKDHGSCTTAATAPPLANALSGLSAEIKQAIFSLLPVASMQALILTCSSLYHCFLDSESAILAKLLQDEIPHSLLQDAFTTFKSSEMTPWNQQTTDNLKILHAAYEKAPLPPKWSLRTATALIEMHSHVEFFANSFASATISQNPVTGHPLPYSGTASPSELVRIKRALYRFEHYCNLSIFRSKHDGGCSSIFARNDRTYAPWENEQLACIREHLLKAVFDALRNTNVQLIAQIFRPVPDWKYEALYYYLPLGLRFLHRFVLANSHKERLRLPHGRPLYSEDFDVGPSGTISDLPLSDMSNEEQCNWIPPPFAHDDDDGPEQAWRWAHADYCPRNWVNVSLHKGLRDIGYVMWDSSRLAAWGIPERDVGVIAFPFFMKQWLASFPPPSGPSVADRNRG